MTATLQLLVLPLLAALLALWAGWLAVAAQADGEVPRVLADQLPPETGSLPTLRALEVAHLALLLLASVAAAGAVAWWTWPAGGAIARLALVVLLVLVVGDSLPRLLGAVAPELSGATRPLAVRSLAALRPLLRLVAWADRWGRRGTPSPPPRGLGLAQRDMLRGLLSLTETTVAEVMTPRLDIVAVDAAATYDEVVTTLRSSEHARLLVYDGHPDAVIGVIYAKDVLAALDEGGDAGWHRLIRPATFVPEGKTLDRQLLDFKRGPGHLAVVVDEFGGTAGIVTLEDILEQVVGEIHDEYDVDEAEPIVQTDPHRFSVQGGAPLADLESVLGYDFGREDVSTVGGLVLAEFGRVPRAGESVTVGEFRLTVEQVVRRRIRRVTVERDREPAAAGAGREGR
ncbi:MAG TPA: hemolysin family protein [Gemmatimonadales bacterium]|nr:hemolysin family protein [Gemmatimonadales bacterium]